MTLKEIKESGVLEDYIFGNPSQENIDRVQTWIKTYPELKEYIFDLEIVVEKLAKENATAPPQSWKSDILSDSKFIQNKEIAKATSVIWMSLVASLLIGAMIGAGLMYGKLQKSKLSLETIQGEYNQLQAECEKEKTLIANSDNLLDYIQDENTEAITLRQSTNKQNDVIVFWNQDQKRAMASIEGLAPLKADESYQIWADVNGEMISLGLLEQETDRFIVLAYKDNAESLNISIEPKGGSEHPTVSRLIMSAKV